MPISAAALVLTIANLFEPPRVDDSAFISLARLIAADPLDPYAGTLLWWNHPTPAVEVIAPPVALYWLAAAIAVLGESVVAWKLSFFAFALLLSASAFSLGRRFCSGFENALMWVVVLAPTVLAGFNLMLDVPALALGLASLATGLHALERRDLRLWLGAALLAGLAAQTKYSAVTFGVLLAAAALQAGAVLWSVAAAVIAGGLFLGWELLVWWGYGASMVFAGVSGDTGSAFRVGVLAMIPAFVLSLGPGLAALLPSFVALAGASVRLIQLSAAWVILAYIAVAWIPAQSWPDGSVPGLSANWLYYLTLGSWAPLFVALFVAALARVASFLMSVRRSGRADPYLELLLAWVLLEILASIVISPFPALRRLSILSVAATFFAFRSLALLRTQAIQATTVGVTLMVSIVAGGLFQLVDLGEGLAESTAMGRAVTIAHSEAARSGGRIWYAGQWAVHYYAEQAQLLAIIPDQTELVEGDVAIVARRPYERPDFSIGDPNVEPLMRVDAAPKLPWALMPNAYSGIRPIDRRSSPTLVLDVLRIKGPWKPRSP